MHEACSTFNQGQFFTPAFETNVQNEIFSKNLLVKLF